MAGESVVGALRVVLGLDTASFEDGLKSSTGHLDKFASGAKLAGVAIATALTAAVVGLGVAIKKTIDHAEELGKTAQQIGLPVERLQELRFAAELSEVSAEELSKSMVILSKNMNTVAGGAKNIAAAAFDTLGISVKDANGKLKSSDQILLEIAESFSKFEDGASKTALAVAIFGRAGAAMIPLLNEGKSSIEKLADEARKLGIILDKETVEAADKFNDNLTRLHKIQEAVVVQITAGMLPSLLSLSQRYVDAANSGKELQDVGKFIGESLQSIVNWAIAAGKAIDILLTPTRALISASILVAKGEFSAALNVLGESATSLIPKFEALLGDLKKFTAETTAATTSVGTMDDAVKKFHEEAKKPAAPMFSEEQFKQAEKFKDEINKLSINTRVLNNEFIALAPGFADAALKFKDFQAFGEKFGTTLETLTPKQKELNAALFQFAGAQITQESLMPWQLYEQQITKLQVAFANGVISAETFGTRSRQIAEATGQAWNLVGSEMLGNLASGLKAFAAQNKSLSGIAKAAAISQALINTYTAATKALATYPPPLSYLAAGAAVVAGLGYVAQIRSQDFQTGGSFTVGGSGGIDSQQIMLNATPGEMVNIRRPGSTGGGVTEVTLVGMGPRDLFSRDMIRDLVNSLNEAHADGYKLKVGVP